MRNRFLLFVAVLLVASCSSTVNSDAPEEVQALQKLDQQCLIYKGALNSLASLASNGQLSQAQIDIVEFWRPQLNAYCASDAGVPTDLESALDLLEQGILELQKLEN